MPANSLPILVISLGGSVIADGANLRMDFLNQFAEVIASLQNKNRIVIVTGGGPIAKSYISSLRQVSSNELMLDFVGIKATELNALAMQSILDAHGVNARVCGDFDSLAYLLNTVSKVVILHGMFPGITTDADAVLACEAVGAKSMVNISKSAFVYSKPPEEHGAKKLNVISHKELVELANKYDTREAKSSFIFDSVACKLASRSDITILFTDDNIKNISRALKGQRHYGTVVKN